MNFWLTFGLMIIGCGAWAYVGYIEGRKRAMRESTTERIFAYARGFQDGLDASVRWANRVEGESLWEHQQRINKEAGEE